MIHVLGAEVESFKRCLSLIYLVLPYRQQPIDLAYIGGGTTQLSLDSRDRVSRHINCVLLAYYSMIMADPAAPGVPG
jgi:hypothetical protein